MPHEIQVTSGPGGRILTNVNVWSWGSQWIVYDTRSDAAGDQFDGRHIEMVNIKTREKHIVYESQNGAHCGVATWHPYEPKVVFILGPEHPTPDWQYGPAHRQGVIVDVNLPFVAHNLDARDLLPPFTPGALRGGSHVHIYHPNGRLVSFTYEDDVLAKCAGSGKPHDLNQRNIGVSLLNRPVTVSPDHPRNHDGIAFTTLVTQTTAKPRPGSDDISKAFEEGWVGEKALAFQGHVTTTKDEVISEVFLVELPDDFTKPGDGPLQGTETRRPRPPAGTAQRRLTNTTRHKYPGIAGPRHWLRANAEGTLIGFYKKDTDGIVQFWTVSPAGGEPRQVTHNSHPIASAFTWHPTQDRVTYVMDHSICITDVRTGETQRITPRTQDSPRPEACVFSPDGRKIAFVRRVGDSNQICVVHLD